ncbi:MAG: 50S ribosomal protein L31 [Thermoflexales bacterium]|nr:50S ribosomal protein L31 [Thermoflexales bacterium]MCS7325310.1 50S ribosomal protein L31 [Thermoflexales bacterium]MCX7938331.1 50S ribosomal protein L31 [Thermoflexales bacterium]MDW8053029.1 50S ribosomal protein L31 [Anaerolineae bacterium]MDW8291682.1 50S ribosomal protein L31 [Anaerolineae bacterium]
MKKDIHPKYYPQAKIYVGGEFVGTIGSTKPELHLDVWSGTHPFYTGQQRLIDTEGQVDRFQKRLERKQEVRLTKAEKARRRREKRRIAEIVVEDENPEAGAAPEQAE